jgi:hypothetical protein
MLNEMSQSNVLSSASTQQQQQQQQQQQHEILYYQSLTPPPQSAQQLQANYSFSLNNLSQLTPPPNQLVTEKDALDSSSSFTKQQTVSILF